MITNVTLWLRAISRFSGFQLHTPNWPNERHVEDYHSIISELEAASKGDFDSFKIKESEMGSPPPAFSFFEPAVAEYKYCDPTIFRARVSGLVSYITMLSQMHSGKPPDPPPAKPKTRTSPSSSIYIENMHSSQLISNSPNSSIKNTFNAKEKEFRDLIELIKATAPKLDLDRTTASQLDADLKTIEAQVESPAPKYSIIVESMSSVRSIVEGIAANVITSGLLISINQFFPH